MKKILIALDYNPSAQQVAEAGSELAKSMNAQVILLHVIYDPTYYSSINYSPIMGFEGFVNTSIPETEEALKSAAQIYLEKSRQHLRDDSIQTVVETGDFAETILNTAKELNADIIVMGRHHRHGIEKIFSGSVTESVLQHSSIPLFIIPTKIPEKN